jgi:FdrA protein
MIRAGQYHDSVTLIQVAHEVTQQAGVVDAAVVMGTQANKAILQQAGLWLPKLEAATSDDLVIVVQADSDISAREALELAGAQPKQRPGGARTDAAVRPRSIRSAGRSPR